MAWGGLICDVEPFSSDRSVEQSGCLVIESPLGWMPVCSFSMMVISPICHLSDPLLKLNTGALFVAAQWNGNKHLFACIWKALLSFNFLQSQMW